MDLHHLDTCVTSLWVQPIPKVTINVVATAKIVTKRQKNGHIMAILSHKGKSYGTDTYATSISIATHDLVRILPLSDIWKYRLQTNSS